MIDVKAASLFPEFVRLNTSREYKTRKPTNGVLRIHESEPAGKQTARQLKHLWDDHCTVTGTAAEGIPLATTTS
ncbi:MAG TPA: hypothetical protein VKD89_04365, partial [Candidatus Udaeobacter sp.]|nr:hypothetical protein [Candidatus Udaeobacter sp.]